MRTVAELEAKLAAAEEVLLMLDTMFEFNEPIGEDTAFLVTPHTPGIKETFEAARSVLAGHALATSQPDQTQAAPHAVIHRAILDVIAATGAYLPPDGIDAQECINRVLQATDNADLVSALNELERNPYRLPRAALAAIDNNGGHP